MTPLGLLNFIVLQWFGFRLARVTAPGMFRAVARRQARVGQIVWAEDIVPGTVQPVYRWTLLRWVWPLTGWWSDYRWIAKRSWSW